MKSVRIAILLSILFLFGCSSSSRVLDVQAKEALDELIGSSAFVFKGQWASPLATRSMNAISNSGLIQPGSTANRIDLTGIVNHLTIKGDSVFAKLPYYGERQIAGPYNSTQIGIQFEGVPDAMQWQYNEKRRAYELEFSINNNTEIFDVNAIFFQNNKASVNINSSQRLTISYHGSISALEKE